MASKHLPNLRQGDDYTIEIKYPAGTDITGFKFYITLKSDFEDLDSTAALQYSTVAGDGLLDDPIKGVCFLTVPAAVMAMVVAGSYFYDLQAIAPSGLVTTLAPPIDDYKYRLSVIPQITRATS
jgi:hypothetical protein